MVAAHPTKTEIDKAVAKAHREQRQKQRAEEEAKKQQKKEAKKKVGNASKGPVKASFEKMDVKAAMGVKKIAPGARPKSPSVEVVSTPPPSKSFRRKSPSIEVVSTPPPPSQASIASGSKTVRLDLQTPPPSIQKPSSSFRVGEYRMSTTATFSLLSPPTVISCAQRRQWEKKKIGSSSQCREPEETTSSLGMY
jgi:hypothetical protein